VFIEAMPRATLRPARLHQTSPRLPV
jgi:hypothetical protein